ncbi:hypothetical protein O6H91_23G001900 [Diphasiastrum complanatum]|uniref:Uncharacterized protein n=1 Tax=Diphasiastrum complanatum TaxID=34168 RepID=A0ACC2A7L9_DIPCM|nr:hypothetical protein O6H91_23G001900 [Diphasiastrum complanatum]
MKKYPYPTLIGSLMYLAICTRPDIAYGVFTLSQYCSNPGIKHWRAIKRILQYLKYTNDYGIKYSKNESFILLSYSDASWLTFKEDSKSLTKGCNIIAGGAISWTCKKQSLVAQPSCEAEYIVASNVAMK